MLSRDERRQALLTLDSTKREYEQEVLQAMDFLTHTGLGMEKALVDDEGFPLDTVDLFAVRKARYLVHCRRNDLQQISDEISTTLLQFHEDTRQEALLQMQADDVMIAQKRAQADQRRLQQERTNKLKILKPFLRVIDVCPAGPAQMCGLAMGDEVLQFGPLDSNNFTQQEMANLVRLRQGLVIVVGVLRGVDYFDCELVPRQWSGRGLLGCSFDSST